MTAPSAEFTRVVALLGFEDWTPAEKIIEALTFTIKPLRALERYERVFADGEAKREAARRRKIAEGSFVAAKSNPGRRLESKEAKIRAGARDILNDTIQNTRNAGLVEMKVVDGERLLRRRERRSRDAATRFLVCCQHGLPCSESVTETEREEEPLD